MKTETAVLRVLEHHCLRDPACRVQLGVIVELTSALKFEPVTPDRVAGILREKGYIVSASDSGAFWLSGWVLRGSEPIA